MRMISIFVFLAFLPSATFAQQPLPGNMPLDRHGNTPANSQTIHDHAGAMNHDDAHTNETRDLPREAGQSAFAAIQEIVVLLEADRKTDWSRVDIEALRQHLIDMQNVTLSTKVLSREISIGIRFEATSDTPAVAASIKRMVIAHVMTMDGVNGWTRRGRRNPRRSDLDGDTGERKRSRQDPRPRLHRGNDRRHAPSRTPSGHCNRAVASLICESAPKVDPLNVAAQGPDLHI